MPGTWYIFHICFSHLFLTTTLWGYYDVGPMSTSIWYCLVVFTKHVFCASKDTRYIRKHTLYLSMQTHILSIYPSSIHPSIHPFIHPSIHPSIHLSIHSSTIFIVPVQSSFNVHVIITPVLKWRNHITERDSHQVTELWVEMRARVWSMIGSVFSFHFVLLSHP